jgi:exopolysaccharide production protein ExoZ
VQYLRLFAVLIVVFTHSAQKLPDLWKGGLGVHFEVGASGVDIFFVISGFIMCLVTETRERSPINFFLQRLARIAPIYWLMTAVMGVLLVANPSVFEVSKFDWRVFFTSLFFIPSPHPTLPGAVPMLQVGWTLNYEFVFYSVFAISMAISFAHRFIISSGVIIASVAAGILFGREGFYTEFYTSSILLEFVLGIGVACLYLNGRLPGKKTSIFLILIGIAALAMMIPYPLNRMSQYRLLFWGAPGALLLLGAVGLEAAGRPREIKVLHALGDASFSIYLTHLFVIGAVYTVWVKAGLGHHFSFIWLGICAVIASLIVGYLTYLYVEKPLMVIKNFRGFRISKEGGFQWVFR